MAPRPLLRLSLPSLVALAFAAPAAAQMTKVEVAAFLDGQEHRLTDVAMQIWNLVLFYPSP